MSRPSKYTFPDVGVRSPNRRRARVVFPLPLSPARVKISGLSLESEKDTSFTAISLALSSSPKSRQALEADPYLIPALINLGNLHYGQDELVEAQALYERALLLAPDVYEAHFNLGNVYHDLGRFEVARGCYEQALALNPEYADAHFYLAVTLEKIGRSQDAKPHWRAYQQLAPNGEWIDLAREFSE